MMGEEEPVMSGSDPTEGAGVLVIIPAYNEAGRVGKVIEEVQTALPKADVLVVDDGSKDETGREAYEAGAYTVWLPTNAGYGAALQTGYKFAVRRGYPFVAQIDGDGQHRAEYLVPMLETLIGEEADLVIGSRFLAADGHYKPSLARTVGIGLFSRIATLACGQPISDPTSGFQVMREPVARFFCSPVYPTDYPDADVLILLHRTGFKVREVAVQMRPSPGDSMHTTKTTPYYVYKMLLSIGVTMLRPKVQPPFEAAELKLEI
jgi:glycosyltransferase involved in cell wall biosynthesis